MSVNVSGPAWFAPMPANQKLVLLKLADSAEHDGSNSRPSLATIASHTGFSERNVQRQLRALKEGGWIEVEKAADRARHHTTTWRVRLDRIRAAQAAVEAEKVAAPPGDKMSPGNSPSPGDKMSPGDGAPGDRMSPGDGPPPGDKMSPGNEPPGAKLSPGRVTPRDPPGDTGVALPVPYPSYTRPGGGLVVVDNKHGDEAEVQAVVKAFLDLRNRHWPDHPNPPAPVTTLATQARARLAAGLDLAAMRAVFERGMAGMAKDGKHPATSLNAFRLSLDDAERKAEKAAAEAASVPAWKARYLAAYREWAADGRQGPAPDADDFRPSDGRGGGA